MNAPLLPDVLRRIDTAGSQAAEGQAGALSGMPARPEACEVWRHRFGTMRIEVIDGVCHVDGCAVLPAARQAGQVGG